MFEFAIDEGLMQRNPAKRLDLPPTRKPCERFLSMDEVHKLTTAAPARERLVLRLFFVAGLRPAEPFALKTDDIQPGELRIDEAIFKGDMKDRQTHLRHADPVTTMKHYQKSIPASQREAVEELDKKFRGEPEEAQALTEKIQ